MFRWPAVVFALLLVGCGSEVSSPVPQPIPFQIRQSTPGSSQTTRLVVGLVGAVAGAGRVRARAVAASLDVVGPSTPGGSFNLVVTVGQQDGIELRFETPAGLSDPILLPPPVSTKGPFLVGGRGPGVVSAPDAQGQVTVTNDAGAGLPPLVQASPSSTLLVSNPSTGEVVTTATDSSGLFRTQIAARSGDTIALLLVDGGATSDYLSFSVP